MSVAFSCSHVERVDTTGVKAKMGEYKIKRVSESDIVERMTSLSNALYAAKIMSDCAEGQTIVDSLSELPELTLEKLDPSNYTATNEKEEEVLEALEYALQQNEPVEPTPQKLNEEAYAYYFTISDSPCDSLANEGVWKLTVNKAQLIQDQF
ncbi:hypothetical protein LAG90_11130 [Marinilongibacter aquaticus]|uniref:hypothetical protein n=1 Tax=Marinilongibacter aquaticus TaxID=2975157 RepID=UPI0021BD485B|nr:hypothetical protein [Marinilongibacter aquaticus]UBM57371.1 hypothetical protein LAG90_11130 [Marinilongibacter aquaticus]